MLAKAGISSTYRWRLAVIAALCLGWAAWSAYDGFVKYPEHNRKVDEFNKVAEQFPDDTDQRKVEWEKIAEANHWNTEDPGHKKSTTDLNFQYGMLALTLPIGLFFLFNYLTSFKRWIGMDAQGLLSNSGQRVDFSSITRLDKRLWKRKGIASVYYKVASGPEKRFKLDDWIYETQPTLVMLKHVESVLKPEQIEGGPPEPTTSEPSQPTN